MVNSENEKPVPEHKLHYNQPQQDEAALSRNVGSIEETDDDTEVEPSEVKEIVPNCCNNENDIELLSEAYHVVYGGHVTKSFLDSLTKIKTLTENTVLHIASLHGNDDIVDLIIKHAPKLLFSYNNKNESALHVAARAKNITTVKKLLEAYGNYKCVEIAKAWLEYNEVGSEEDLEYDDTLNMEDLLDFVNQKNNKGNTMLHEAMILSSDDVNKCSIGGMVLKAFEPYDYEDKNGRTLAKFCYTYALKTINHAKQSVLYLAVVAGDKEAVQLILDNFPEDSTLSGLSPIVAAIMKQDSDILDTILKIKQEWKHLKDKHERLPLHYAASTGYNYGVIELLKRCKCCTIQKDKYGYFPLHLASRGGHVEAVKELLNHCPNPAEMLDNSRERNFVHIAAKNGKHGVIQYILKQQQNTQYNVGEIINQKDKKGDTPLHLAARSCHPKTVYYLTLDNRVNLGLLNQNNETALDVVTAIYLLDSSSLRQQLTWTALKSAGAKLSSSRRVVDHRVKSKLAEKSPKLMEESDKKDSNNTKPNEKEENPKQKSEKMNEKEENPKQKSEKEENPKWKSEKMIDKYKDRVDTLILVSTLIITASVAACLSTPGEADGKAHNLNHAMYQFFIIFITISLFSSTSATIILLWTRLGLIELLTHSIQIAMPVLGIALISLFLAFMAGLYTFISELLWLSNIFLFINVIFIVVVVILYMLLFLPSSSTRKPLRYISHHPFLYLASLAEPKSSHGINF